MKVFISWSGNETKSLAVAKVLDAWLPTVLNAVEPWISSRGLSAGLKWNQQLEKELDDTSFGIIVVTPWNQNSQWLNFEAGALSKRVKGSEARVAPLLIDFPSVANLSGPLSSYQAVEPTKEGIKGLVVSINEALGEEARKLEALERAFEVCWPDLENRMREINDVMKSESDPSQAPTPQPASVEEGDKFNQILIALRELQRSDARLKSTITAQTALTPMDSPPSHSRHQADVDRHRIRKIVNHTLAGSGVDCRGVAIFDGTVHIDTTRALSAEQEEMVVGHLLMDTMHRKFHFHPGGPENSTG